MTEPALALAFFDGASGLSGTARAGMTLLFRGTAATTLPEGPAIEPREGGGARATLADRLTLEFEPVADEADLGDVRARVCRVRGRVEGTAVECLGTLSETLRPPAWAELDAVRALSAVFDEHTAVLAVSRRPRGALGHGQELVRAQLLLAGELLAVEDARISTVYDDDGRQRHAGLELWLPGADFSQRASGSAVAGASLALDGLDVHAAVFRWRMDGRDGLGLYELAARREPPAAA